MDSNKHNKGRVIGLMCVGTFILALFGLLALSTNDDQHTSRDLLMDFSGVFDDGENNAGTRDGTGQFKGSQSAVTACETYLGVDGSQSEYWASAAFEKGEQLKRDRALEDIDQWKEGMRAGYAEKEAEGRVRFMHIRPTTDDADYKRGEEWGKILYKPRNKSTYLDEYITKVEEGYGS